MRLCLSFEFSKNTILEACAIIGYYLSLLYIYAPVNKEINK